MGGTNHRQRMKYFLKTLKDFTKKRETLKIFNKNYYINKLSKILSKNIEKLRKFLGKFLENLGNY